MFWGFTKIKKVVFCECDTSEVKDMGAMFADCESLTDISGLSSLDTSNVETMDNLFDGCMNLSDVSVMENWDMRKVRNISGMFDSCVSLKYKSSNLSNIDEM